MRTKRAAIGVVTTVKLVPHVYQRYKMSRLTMSQLVEAGLDSLRPETPREEEIEEFEPDLASVVRAATEDSP